MPSSPASRVNTFGRQIQCSERIKTNTKMECHQFYTEYEELDTMDIMNATVGPPNLDDEAALESTMNISTILEATLPLFGPPDRTPIQNNCNFKVEISSINTNRRKYLYSSLLNRIYVDMNCDFAVQFSWENIPMEKLYVRATVVFTDKDQSEKRVERCMQHRHDNIVNESIRMNVLRSSREVGTQGVSYHGISTRADSWYSVVVELPNNGQPSLHAFKFVCKNSCSSGINRRPISIIFTLEDAFGNVYGREITGARVCSCPRRDLLKDEENEGVFRSGKKRANTNQNNTSNSKKVKIEVAPTSPATLDTNILTLPQLQVVGHNVLATGLQMMVQMMAQGMSARSDDPQYVASCTACITGLEAAIEQLKTANPQ
ncbi:hypothetical protein evm_009807 [Chilo suppressalis]|nr:hypothetical protein evm_009807 [Chilo suppressalis]